MRIIFVLFFTLLLAAPPVQAMDVDVKVSSVKLDFGLPYSPDHLLDGNPHTAWVGGGIGPGVGQWIELHFAIPTRVVRLGVFNGYQVAGEYEKYRRIRSGRIMYPDGSEVQFWLRDEQGEQVIECQGKPVKTLRLVIDEVFPKGELTSKMKVAVSELKLYLSLVPPPAGTVKEAVPDPAHIPAPPPVGPDRLVPEGIIELLQAFYVRQTSLAESYAELFAEDVRDRNDFRFEVFKEVQRQQGTYALLRTAQVDTSGLGFEMVEQEGAFARVRVFGAYRVKVAHVDTNLEEDSTFVLTKGADGWKIVEMEGEEDLF